MYIHKDQKSLTENTERKEDRGMGSLNRIAGIKLEISVKFQVESQIRISWMCRFTKWWGNRKVVVTSQSQDPQLNIDVLLREQI